MGSGKRLTIGATGFPGTNRTWRFIQDAWREPLNALALLAGEKTIVSGMINSAGVISDGFISYQGEIIPFQGGPLLPDVTIVEEIENVTYDVDIDNDGNQDTLPTYRTRYARFGTDGIATFEWGLLERLKTIVELSNYTLPDGVVIDPTYIKFTTVLLNKLNGIEAGAETNVRSDWNEEAPASDAHILNKPFKKIAVTRGTLVCTTLEGGSNNNNPTKNFVNVYPPSGFSIDNLVGFIPTLSQVFFGGDVNQDDTLWCNYQINYGGGYVTVYANNSEYSAAPRIHYLAIWMKLF